MNQRRSLRVGPGLVFFAAVLTALSARALPQDAAAARTLRLSDYYDLEGLGALEVTPDGSRVIFTRARPDAEEDKRQTSIWSVSRSGEDLRRLVEQGSSPRLAPDGRRLAYLHEGQVWILRLPEGEAWRLTGLPGGVSEFDWAPDGAALVVAGTEPPETPGSVLPEDELLAIEQEARVPEEVELPPLDAGAWIPADTAEPAAAVAEPAEPVVSGPYPTGVLVPPVDPEADPERPVPAVITRLQFKADGQGYIGVRPRHLFIVEIPPGPAEPVPARRLTGSEFSDGAPRWSPSGDWIAFSSKRSRNPDTNDNVDIWLVPPAGGEPIQVTTSPGQDGTPRWSPTGTHVAYRHVPEDPPVYANATLRIVAVGGADPATGLPAIGAPVDLTGALDRPVAAPAVWAADGASVYTLLEDRGMVSLIRVSTGLERSDQRRRRGRRAPTPPAGTTAAIIAGPRAVSSFALLPDETEVVAVISHADSPPEIYAAAVEPRPGAVPLTDPAGHVQPRAIPPAALVRNLTSINRDWADAVLFSDAEPLRFNSTDEKMIEGWLLRPPGYQEGLRYPLIVRIHGGPVAQFNWGFSFERQWLAGQGYAVLYMNPRGSSGYGQEFALSLWADWGGPDLEDILAGVDHLVLRGIADPERLGVGGWSYGGILTNYLITRSDRFQAAIAGASEADYFACYGVDDLQGWWENELGLPYEPEARARYEAMSPIYDIQRVVTPTLFLVGENDWRVPAAQSEQIYAQLRRRMVDGGPLTGLIVYPGESHGISRPSFVIDRWRRYRAWYDLHLRNDASADPFFGLRAW